MHTQTFAYELTWGDLLALRTGYPILTVAVAGTYLLLLTLLIPGAFRVWAGIAREALASLLGVAERTGRAVVRVSSRPLTAVALHIPLIEGVVRAHLAVKESRRNPDFTLHI
jgi:hypothetical protein